VSARTTRPADGLAGLAGVHDLTADGENIRFSVDPDDLNAALQRLTDFGIRAMTSSPPTLEELFLRHYGDEVDVRKHAELASAR
jgi:ABC-2 type transport system ATP-binding protein